MSFKLCKAVWDQHENSLNLKLLILITAEESPQNYQFVNAHSNQIFCRHEVVELHDKIIIEIVFLSVNLLILILH